MEFGNFSWLWQFTAWYVGFYLGSSGNIFHLTIQAILFCVGVEMVSSGVGKGRLICYMLIMSWITPLGVAIGIIVTSQGTRQESPDQVKLHEDLWEFLVISQLRYINNRRFQILAVAVLQGLAAGTLLYITFYEVRNLDIHTFMINLNTGAG